MRQLAKIVRFWFGLQAVLAAIVVLVQPLVVYRSIAAATGDADELRKLWIGTMAILAVGMVMAGVFGKAWWALGKGYASARSWAIAASVLSIPVIGPGTIAGLIGLAVFTRTDIASQVAPPERPRIQGDGTSAIGDRIASVASIAFLMTSLHWWHAWADGQGLPQADGFY